MKTLSRAVWLLACTSLLTLAPVATTLAKNTGESWESKKVDQHQRTLIYSTTATLLGKPTPIKVAFLCDTTASKNVNGALGFDLSIAKSDQLKPFSFEDFEGPDAAAHGKKLVQMTVVRTGKPKLVQSVVPNGGFDEGGFVFTVSDLSKAPKSVAKTILRALAEADAESLSIVITDTRDAKLKLEVTVPVTGKQGEFKTLLAGLK